VSQFPKFPPEVIVELQEKVDLQNKDPATATIITSDQPTRPTRERIYESILTKEEYRALQSGVNIDNMQRVTFFNPERYLERTTQFTNTDGREAKNFFGSFEDACEAGGIRGEDRKSRLKTAVTGELSVLLEDVESRNANLTYEETKAQLISRFSSASDNESKGK